MSNVSTEHSSSALKSDEDVANEETVVAETKNNASEECVVKICSPTSETEDAPGVDSSPEDSQECEDYRKYQKLNDSIDSDEGSFQPYKKSNSARNLYAAFTESAGKIAGSSSTLIRESVLGQPFLEFTNPLQLNSKPAGVTLKPSVLSNSLFSNAITNSFESNAAPKWSSSDKRNEEDKWEEVNKNETVSSSTPSTSSTSMFLISSDDKAASVVDIAPTTTTPSFVFGQNLHERVAMDENSTVSSENANGVSSTGMLFSSSIKEETSSVLAQNEKNRDEVSSTKSLTESAKEYEEAISAKRGRYDEVTVFTGEENETNILQINCKLFAFENTSSSWVERGRGMLRLNDAKMNGEDSSRIIVRTFGNLRVVLNTKIWKGMNVERATPKSVRLTAFDNSQIKIYLVMSGKKEIDQLFDLLTQRVENMQDGEND